MNNCDVCATVAFLVCDVKLAVFCLLVKNRFMYENDSSELVEREWEWGKNLCGDPWRRKIMI